MAAYTVGVDSEETFTQVRAELAEAARRAVLANNGGVWPVCGTHDVDLDLDENCFICNAENREFRVAGLSGRV